VTLEPDGAPPVTLVWVGLEDDEIVAALWVWRKVANIRPNPRVVLWMESGNRTANRQGSAPEFFSVSLVSTSALT
jgi:hypothetical protein